ncbi:MAG: hypothetical protein AAFP69_07085, partial [Planctomycetota bacterium]
ETALNAIRAFGDPGSHHPQRNVIISAPRNTQQDSLRRIDADILTDDHVLVEYHAYAAGAKDSGRNAWSGNGSAEDRARLTDRIDSVMAFTDETGVPIYWGAWMPMDNKTSTLSQREVENFATFFAETLGEAGIPWSMNKLQNYYDVETGDWVRNTSFGSGSDRKEINVQRALAAAVDAHESTQQNTQVVEASASIRITNTGDEDLRLTSLTSDLAGAFAETFDGVVSVRVVRSDARRVPQLNPAFDGGFTDSQIFDLSNGTDRSAASHRVRGSCLACLG